MQTSDPFASMNLWKVKTRTAPYASLSRLLRPTSIQKSQIILAVSATVQKSATRLHQLHLPRLLLLLVDLEVPKKMKNSCRVCFIEI
jgi:hypothetical protein